MIPGAKYGHTNLIAKDWRELARFYQEQFGCIPVPTGARLQEARIWSGGRGFRVPSCAGRTCDCPGTARTDRRSRSSTTTS